MKKLGINIDHIATLRNARNCNYVSMIDACMAVKNANAELITIHLREDRRHIRDSDVFKICQSGILPVNLEIAPTDEMVEIAIQNKVYSVCFVPEKREELTTEGGLDVMKNQQKLSHYTKHLQENGIKVCLFVEPSINQIESSKTINANIVEIHTGTYAINPIDQEILRIKNACIYSDSLGLETWAGHGLTFQNIIPLLSINELSCFNIGHFLIADSIFHGLENSIRKMISIINSQQ
jgi:pyridoxine 5-phosphate synthase